MAMPLLRLPSTCRLLTGVLGAASRQVASVARPMLPAPMLTHQSYGIAATSRQLHGTRLKASAEETKESSDVENPFDPVEGQPRRTVQVRRAPKAEGSADHDAKPKKKKKKKPKTPVPPTPVASPLSQDLSVWENGVLLVDKPTDWTSFDICNKVRYMVKPIGVKKVGHAGTLDPSATGLLILCTGKGTKSVETFMGEDKEYVGTMRIGEATPTYDADMPPDSTAPWEHIDGALIEKTLPEFTGDIEQVPPMFSAVKIKGQTLHQLARRGVEVDRPPRPIKVHDLRVWHEAGDDPQILHYAVKCGKGTYVRSLVHDLGKALGSAAHVVTLRRTAIGKFKVEDAWQIDQLQEELNAVKEQLGIKIHKSGVGERQQHRKAKREARAAKEAASHDSPVAPEIAATQSEHEDSSASDGSTQTP